MTPPWHIDGRAGDGFCGGIGLDENTAIGNVPPLPTVDSGVVYSLACISLLWLPNSILMAITAQCVLIDCVYRSVCLSAIDI